MGCFPLPDVLACGGVRLQLLDWDNSGDDDPMGDALLTLAQHEHDGQKHTLALPLQNVTHGVLHVRVRVWKPRMSRVSVAELLQKRVRSRRIVREAVAVRKATIVLRRERAARIAFRQARATPPPSTLLPLRRAVLPRAAASTLQRVRFLASALCRGGWRTTRRGGARRATI